MDQDMRPPFHLISQFRGLIPFSQQKGLRVQKRVHFSPNQTNQIYINMIEAIFDSESGTTLHQSHWSGVRNLTGVIGKVSDVVSVVHVHHDFSSRKGAC